MRTGLLLILLVASACSAPQWRAGLRFGSAANPVRGAELTYAVFYPTQAAPSRVVRGPYEIDAAADAPIARKRFPLIILSHGHGGTKLGHHDSAAHLARNGFVVVAAEHAGDSATDQSGFGSTRVLIGRQLQLLAVLDAVLADPSLAPSIDARRIGAAGFSAGGYTALLAAGARPDFALLEGYCRRNPEDRELCALKPAAANDPLRLVDDHRVRAAFVMAPLGVFFDRKGLENVRVPIHLVYAGDDRILIPSENALRIRDGLPTRPEVEEIRGAGHFVFLAPCPTEMAREEPVFCQDPPSIDRAAIHARINDAMLRFFRRTL